MALDQAKQQAIKDGNPVSSVFDVNNPKSMWGQVERFHLPPEEVLKQLSGNVTKTQFPETTAPAVPPTEKVRVQDANGKTFTASRAWLNANPTKGYKEIK